MNDQRRGELQAEIKKYRQHATLAIADPVTKERVVELIAELEEELRRLDN